MTFSMIDPQNLMNLEAKVTEIARNARGNTWMGPGQYINDGNGSHSPANWCEAFAETVAAMATGIRIRFPSAENHYQNLLAQGKIHTDDNPPEGMFVFYHWAGDAFGHITVSSGNGNTIGTVISPDAILELPIHHYSGYAGYAEIEAVLQAADQMAPADPTGGGMGRRNGNYRSFSWLTGPNNESLVVGNAVLDLWEKDGPVEGITRYGYPLDNEHQETNDHNVALVVQNFERNRVEYNPATNSTGVGRVGAEMLSYWQKDNSLGANILIEPNTNNIDPNFVSYWQTHGGLEVIGLPLTGIVTIPNSNFPSQVFERAVLEKHDDESWPVQGRAINGELVKLRNSGDVGQISG